MIMWILGITVVAAPLVLVFAIGIFMLTGHPLSERGIARLTQMLVTTALLAACLLLAIMLSTDRVRYVVDLGRWVDLPTEHFHFTLKFLFDRLSIPFVILSLALCGVISAFANRYMHRDEGYLRFFFLYAIFMLGMVVSAVAGTIETLFLGWELVGLSSALLVAFFQTRTNPVRNGLRVWTIYRFADGAFLLAALVLHHLTGGGDLELMMGEAPWPDSICPISSTHALVVGTLLLVAAAGKSALIPFSGWLPRAMEGPTPSSAIFYGALSVHLGAFLLLRIAPMLEQSFILQAMIVLLGTATAIYAAITANVQTDVKSALALASLLQVSIIVVEIGLGLRYLALIHIIGHASMRSLQLLRAPSLLRDQRHLADNLGYEQTRTNTATQPQPSNFHLAVYRWSLERGYFDSLLDGWIATPCVRLFRWCDRLERKWNRVLSGESKRHPHSRPGVQIDVDAPEEQ